MGALLGYARVSTGDQDPSLQVDALTGAGCLRVFTDTASGRCRSARSWRGCWSSCGRGTPWWCGGWTGWAGPCGT